MTIEDPEPQMGADGGVPDEDGGADDEFPEGTTRPSEPGGGSTMPQDEPVAAPTRPPSDS
jgi:hypothetical protein